LIAIIDWIDLQGFNMIAGSAKLPKDCHPSSPTFSHPTFRLDTWPGEPIVTYKIIQIIKQLKQPPGVCPQTEPVTYSLNLWFITVSLSNFLYVHFTILWFVCTSKIFYVYFIWYLILLTPSLAFDELTS